MSHGGLYRAGDAAERDSLGALSSIGMKGSHIRTRAPETLALCCISVVGQALAGAPSFCIRPNQL